jgi:acetyl-CoA carboxylase biotin carboxylase subunit
MQIIPGSDVLKRKEDALRFAEKQGYPIILKSCYGGGGKGIRTARNKKELLGCFDAAAKEVETSFGTPLIYAEKYIKARHIEFQFIADKHGNYACLGDRECSIQRRFQKLIEETPSPALTSKERKRICHDVCELVKSIDYAGVGTAEFLLTPDKKIYFLEVNPRIQVEHGITELITGIDIAKEQLRIAQGLPLSFNQGQVRIKGHAIECRIVAECARRDFAPAGGIISRLELGQPDKNKPDYVRVDAALYPGLRINPSYDSLLAKLMVHGRSRKEAVKKLRQALAAARIEGVQNTIDFYKFLTRQKRFIDGKLSTEFISENRLVEKYSKESLLPEIVALIASAIYEHEANHLLSFPTPDRWVESSRKEAVEAEPEERWG